MRNFPLPLRDFRFMTQEELEQFDPARDITEEEGPGYMLQVTLRYPPSLHLRHNSFPLAPESVTITNEDLSPYAARCWSQLSSAGGGGKQQKKEKKYKATKLTATFNDRVHYWVHGLNLKFYLEQGLELLKLHRGVRFHQQAFLAPYIQMCMQRRAASKTKVENTRWKMLSNAVYGKMIESTANRMEAHFLFEPRKALLRYSDPLYRGSLILDEDFSVSFNSKRVIRLTQAWPVGFTILELSKLVMYRLFYEVLQPAFDGRLTVLMSDTDSFAVLAPGSSPDEICSKIAHVMDFSNYSPSHPLYDVTRKNTVGLLKNEVSQDTIVRFAGVRSKTYAFVTAGEYVEAKAKGVGRQYKKKITFDAYKQCLDEICAVNVKQVSIQAKNHANMLVQSEKAAFNSMDDKRYLLCAIHSVPYGSILATEHVKTGRCYFCDNPNVYS